MWFWWWQLLHDVLVLYNICNSPLIKYTANYSRADDEGGVVFKLVLNQAKSPPVILITETDSSADDGFKTFGLLMSPSRRPSLLLWKLWADSVEHYSLSTFYSSTQHWLRRCHQRIKRGVSVSLLSSLDLLWRHLPTEAKIRTCILRVSVLLTKI
jgi:hypothetical protein